MCKLVAETLPHPDDASSLSPQALEISQNRGESLSTSTQLLYSRPTQVWLPQKPLQLCFLLRV